MKETGKKKISNNNQTKRSGRRDNKLHQENVSKTLKAKESRSKASFSKPDSSTLVIDSNTGKEPSEVYENLVIHYVDDLNRFEEAPRDLRTNAMVSKESKDEVVDNPSIDLEKDPNKGKEEVSYAESVKDSISSQGDLLTADCENVDRASGLKRSPTESGPGRSKERSEPQSNQPQSKVIHNTSKKSITAIRGPAKVVIQSSSETDSEKMKFASETSSESSAGVDDKPVEEVKEADVLDGASNSAQSIGTDDDIINAEESDEHEDETALEQKIEEMEMRIERLEEELREVAALEISLYSVVPEHGSSAHKVHTPARRLSRLYIHACKHWTLDKRATVAKNTMSGLVLIAKSCGNDVPRLTFWLTNTVVLREIISQAFGRSRQFSPVARLSESNGSSKSSEGKSTTLKWKGGFGSKQANGFMQLVEDWQETGTFTAALEKVESWIFSRIVESVWWQALTPNMLSSSENMSSNKNIGRLLGPVGDQQQGSFSVNLWKNAFQDALQRLCPVRAGGHECGCLPVLARMVMERCVDRLDFAMFNAILRESAHEIPTDPISDPIVDSKVLPIPAGDLSFGSGAQLKNSIGNWSRWLTDMFGMDSDDSLKENQHGSEDDDMQGGAGEPKSFLLLNELSDLLMLPKDMLMDRPVREEVCPSISLPLIKRILCNFTPDEFCPDPVPGAVLEALNAESTVQRRLSGDSARSFPYTAAPFIYNPPSSAEVAEKVAEAGEKSPLATSASAVQRKGYTSDEELEELDSPLASIIEKLPSSPTITANGNVKQEHTDYASINARYELLREVWSV
ncbi:uncharacterized protein LOC122278217 isoform X1 [Carya illinoinensis]|uniref:uncharacterized protein LOC122278217 isoform X1 n=1 Tax=Carya illinoinensis TaxID=32201 RepID=UPI001C72566A|nr:uncharacterized protein LOC122278217 isoform X1 [Carya illinoinensis]XP_042944289.1 uncharacterized protein LOC122278217 isoform X1 [Carya illinoinensis]XP_042944290.1 uncharacterized protein LOC122278217 isoform X1 [Carya illinoinensis]XP_042944291.1 uncharacterized protein LOC122278217 isoform X1 [Carya illinoinensis]XP_042944292.1 uncharacterized protein LOC122278217 isoform X1 [Carya illinoinensis]XP_042944293.1 uncharacterized protein LOC122278217 isoform X1 [Carya illinoinensis]XP_04